MKFTLFFLFFPRSVEIPMSGSFGRFLEGACLGACTAARSALPHREHWDWYYHTIWDCSDAFGIRAKDVMEYFIIGHNFGLSCYWVFFLI